MLPRRTWPQRLLLAALATLLALALAEAAARCLLPGPPRHAVICAPGGERVPLGEIAHFLTHRARFHEGLDGRTEPRGRLQPGLHLRYQYPNARWAYFDADKCVSVDVNSLGFRDDEFPRAKPPGELRILAVGDSFTHGQGVQLRDSWPQVLERELQRLRPGPVQVINGGFACGAHSPDGYDRWMASDGIHFAPDLVIVGFCLNDMGDVPLLSYPIAPRTAVLGSVLLGEVARQLEQRRLRAQPRDLAEPVRRAPAAWEATQRGLRAMQALLAKRSIPLVVAVFPCVSELDRYPYEGLHAMAREFCASAGIRCVDLQHAFDGRADEDLWVDATDQHPNDVGQRLLALGVLDYLRRERLLP